jgi:hypothetical protein
MIIGCAGDLMGGGERGPFRPSTQRELIAHSETPPAN